MTRVLYALLWLAATPFVVLRLLVRARSQRGYAEHIGERFGNYPPAPRAPRIWIHAVSVGETRAAAPLVEALAKSHPGHRILVTHMTATGRATGVELFGDRVERAWLPYDLGFAVRRFLAHYRPDLGIVLETEVWPRLLEECRAAGVPVVLANARMSERSARGYARFPAFTRWAFANLAGIAAQTQADAERLCALGAGEVEVTGNVKFDLEPPGDAVQRGEELRRRLGSSRAVWVAGSTREGEEALLLDALAAMPGESALLAIVPRHPQRFDEVAALARARGFEVARRSDAGDVGPGVRVFVGDSMGEMPVYYAASDVVVMGGSLLPYGSQNLIEPCALGKPVIVGPSTYNFEEAADGAIGAGAAIRVGDARAALALAAALGRDAARRERMGRNAREFVVAHRGAIERLMAWLERKAGPALSRARASG
ncbi:MAG TPA: lipid IV(A) 3-deoxy-D-manno-octulosonic acid transferase [Usitatibacter sp.]|jgi:3-deoxy-D-manno-octulosonic-acid transferase|nr:lipid IV(A) 3-deoxy-D-manno-octulosonic acid transferase [Usitatibacter sp.]